MTNKQSKVFRSIIFVLGLAIIAMCFALFKADEMNARHTFMWCNIVVLYCAFFIPFLFVTVHIEDADSKAPSLVLLWIPVLFFDAAGIVLTVLSVLGYVAVSVACVSEAVLLFLGVILVYFGVLAGSHIKAVKQNETQAMELLKRIRSAMELLALKATSLNDSYSAEKNQIGSLAEDVKYISPVNDIAAAKFEQDIMGKITAVSSMCDTVIAGSDGAEFKRHLASLDVLIKQRKAMKN